MSKPTRDPRVDPQAGDIIEKVSTHGGVTRRRTVTRRDGNDIYYTDQSGQAKKCWISSWLEWARMATLPGETLSNGDPLLAAKDLILQRCSRMANDLVIEYKQVESEHLVKALTQGVVTEGEIVKAFRSGLRRVIMEHE